MMDVVSLVFFSVDKELTLILLDVFEKSISTPIEAE